LLNIQLATYKFNNGTMNTYGAGLGIDSVRGWKIISHSGATAGYRSSLEHFPELSLSIAWISNTSEFDRSSSAAAAESNLLVKDKMTANSQGPTH
jgi:hypothetical protein